MTKYIVSHDDGDTTHHDGGECFLQTVFHFFSVRCTMTFMHFYVSETNFNTTLCFTIVGFQSLYVNEFPQQ